MSHTVHTQVSCSGHLDTCMGLNGGVEGGGGEGGPGRGFRGLGDGLVPHCAHPGELLPAGGHVLEVR